jgi:hypothetical protein
MRFKHNEVGLEATAYKLDQSPTKPCFCDPDGFGVQFGSIVVIRTGLRQAIEPGFRS